MLPPRKVRLVDKQGEASLQLVLNDIYGKFSPTSSGQGVNDIITNGPWVDVRASGAKADGVTDDTAAITAAKTVAGSGILYFPHSATGYKITSPIVPTSDCTIMFESSATKLLNYSTTTGGVIGAADKVKIINGYLFDMVSGTRTAGSAIDIAGNGTVITGTRISGHYDGVKLTNTYTSILSNVRSDSALHDAFGIYGTGTSTIYIGTYANAPARHGYYAEGYQSYLTYIGTASEPMAGGGNGYDFNGPNITAVTMISPGCEPYSGNTGSCIHIVNSKGFTITSPYLSHTSPGAGANSIWIEGGQYIKIDNGFAQNYKAYGLKVTASTTTPSQTPAYIRNDDLVINSLEGGSATVYDPTSAIITGLTRVQTAFLGVATPIADSAAANYSVYIASDHGNALYYKDGSGVSHALY